MMRDPHPLVFVAILAVSYVIGELLLYWISGGLK
jgi:hypothetical protein